MKKIIQKWLAALLLISIVACGDQTSQSVATEQTQQQVDTVVVNVGANAVFAPFEYTNQAGEVEGFDIDLMNAIAKAAGFKVVYKQTAWDAIFASLVSMDNDALISAITITKERAQSMDFSDPYFEIKQVVLMRDAGGIESAEDLKKFDKVGVITGQTGDLIVQKILGATSAKIARFDTLPLVIRELEGGGIEALVTDSAVVEEYLKQHTHSKFHMISLEDFPIEQYGIAVRKGDSKTLNMINDGLRKIRENHEYERIYQQYFAVQ